MKNLLLAVWLLVACFGAIAQDADRDGIPDSLESSVGRDPFHRDNDVLGNPELFAMQQFRDFLKRESDAAGRAYWAGQISSGFQTRATVIEGFFGSPEFQGAIAPVARLYFAYFLRIPDYNGLDYWVSEFRANRRSLAGISALFAQSDEFRNRYGALTDTDFVTLVYQNVLGRAPERAGLEHWVKQLAQGNLSRGDVMVNFSESPEYVALVDDQVYVTMMYMGMLRRAPDQSGFAFWVKYRDAGNSGIALINGFLGSTEYSSRFLGNAPVNIEGSILQAGVIGASNGVVSGNSIALAPGTVVSIGQVVVAGEAAIRVQSIGSDGAGRVVVTGSPATPEEVFSRVRFQGHVTEDMLSAATLDAAPGAKVTKNANGSYTVNATFSEGGSSVTVTGEMSFKFQKAFIDYDFTWLGGVSRFNVDLEVAREFQVSVTGALSLMKRKIRIFNAKLPIGATGAYIYVPVFLNLDGSLVIEGAFQFSGKETTSISGKYTKEGGFQDWVKTSSNTDEVGSPQDSSLAPVTVKLAFVVDANVNPQIGVALLGTASAMLDFKGGAEMTGSIRRTGPAQERCVEFKLVKKLSAGVLITAGSFEAGYVISQSSDPWKEGKIGAGCMESIQTTSSISSDPPSPSVGETVILTAQVVPATLGPAMGVVNFSSNGRSLCSGVPVSGGLATCATQFVSEGALEIKAHFMGVEPFLNSEAALSIAVQPGPPAFVSLVANPHTPWVGQVVSFRAYQQGGITPAGSITITIDGKPLCTYVVENGGTALCEMTFSAAGGYEIKATHSTSSAPTTMWLNVLPGERAGPFGIGWKIQASDCGNVIHWHATDGSSSGVWEYCTDHVEPFLYGFDVNCPGGTVCTDYVVQQGAHCAFYEIRNWSWDPFMVYGYGTYAPTDVATSSGMEPGHSFAGRANRVSLTLGHVNRNVSGQAPPSGKGQVRGYSMYCSIPMMHAQTGVQTVISVSGRHGDF